MVNEATRSHTVNVMAVSMQALERGPIWLISESLTKPMKAVVMC